MVHASGIVLGGKYARPSPDHTELNPASSITLAISKSSATEIEENGKAQPNLTPFHAILNSEIIARTLEVIKYFSYALKAFNGVFGLLNDHVICMVRYCEIFSNRAYANSENLSRCLNLSPRTLSLNQFGNEQPLLAL